MKSWTKAQREAVRAFLGEAMPNNAAIIVENVEDFMPVGFRLGFEKIFEGLAHASRFHDGDGRRVRGAAQMCRDVSAGQANSRALAELERIAIAIEYEVSSPIL